MVIRPYKVRLNKPRIKEDKDFFTFEDGTISFRPIYQDDKTIITIWNTSVSDYEVTVFGRSDTVLKPTPIDIKFTIPAGSQAVLVVTSAEYMSNDTETNAAGQIIMAGLPNAEVVAEIASII